MRNPLRTEAEAFRFLCVVIVGAAIIGGASYANTWLGVAAAVLVVAGVAWWLMHPATEAPSPRLASGTPAGTHRVLVVAGPGSTAGDLAGQLRERTTEAVVLVPALASPVEALTGAVDDRRAEAQATADALAGQLSGSGLQARAEVGADDPLLAIEDALRAFGADEIALLGEEEGLLERVRERFALPARRLTG